MDSKKAGRPKTNNVVEMDQTYTLCQEGGFINPSDLEQIMKDLGDENHLNLYIDETIEEYVDIPPEFVDIDEMCDSTQGDEDTIMKIKTEYMSPTCTFPCTENYPGPYNFELVLDSSTSNRKSWVVRN
uniref:Uncharacterized protein n=1 Tax=Clastoptera arizonana TaxID=38151 RepID=A0A1B6DBA9_9HEMI